MVKDQDLIDAVRGYAVEHYNEDGWDYVVECWEDWEIQEIVRGCRSESQAIRKVRKQVKVLGDYRDEIRATAW